MTICHTMTLCRIPMTTCHLINNYTLLSIRNIIRISNDNNNVTNKNLIT